MKIIGYDKLIKQLKAIGKQGVEEIELATADNATKIARDAIRLAPYDLGTLRRNILALEIDKLNWKVLANATGEAPYSAYMEFGTGGLVEVPEELKEVAIKFIGKGIKRVDIRPRPYLYPAFVQGRVNYIDDLEKALERLTK